MSEDELLTGLADALTLGGWRWNHTRRSDRALVMGHPGWPDLVAVHPHRPHLLAIECKTEHGIVSADQQTWLRLLADQPGVLAFVVRPEQYDATVEWIVGDRLLPRKTPPRGTHPHPSQEGAT